jgi:hypothetical protein
MTSLAFMLVWTALAMLASITLDVAKGFTFPMVKA